ncbi:hypothetical protein VTO73DRAFT_12758 [Trametes versicolor]
MTFFPLPGTYVVAELDVEKTLAPLADPLANAAASAIKPAKCIVYLSQVLRHPFLHHATFKYTASVVGPGLRPEDPEFCLTRDMCVPIFPNTHHPSADRAPVQPRTGPFPFGNCYHWFGGGMALDLRVLNDGQRYPEEGRVSLSANEQARLERLCSGDAWRAYGSWKAREDTNADRAPLGAVTAPQEPVPVLPAAEVPDNASLAPSYMTYWQSVRYLRGESSPSIDAAPGAGGAPSHRSSEDVNDIGFVLDCGEGEDLLPIVRIWPDVAAQFKKDSDVPDPTEFLKQCEEIVRIMQESKALAQAEQAAPGRARARFETAQASIRSERSLTGEKRRRSQGFLARLGSVLCLRALSRA